MGLLNARNLRKAKQLLEQNRDKVGDVVEKAGTQLDKVSKGKTANVTSKAADAAKKYSAGGVTNHGVDVSPTDAAQPGDPLSDSGSSPADPYATTPRTAEEAKVRQAEATATAANAVTGAANALTNLMNKAAAKAESKNAARTDDGGGAAGATDVPSSIDDIPTDEFDRG